MVRHLKPGGLLILTGDYYFESLWRRPEALRAGVVRADGSEFTGGWNRVEPAEWQDLCACHGLQPLLAPAAPPAEDDPGLYRNPEPFPHATIAAVYQKPPISGLPGGRRIGLGLLTWNTCDISLESAQAYVREARLLQRLGHQPFFCICDNGSSDGTAEALRRLEAGLDLPHRFIYNPDNRGNSLGRNQMIDAMLAADCEYLLFLDGDIEIVPFSSVALLAYMESQGGMLGCIGVDYAGCTPDRSRISPSLYSLAGRRIEATDLVAWTQYGLFRREVFAGGVRFDESEPFAGAGWGFEDNDLAFQMAVRGFAIHCFFGMTYLHRAVHSSLRILRQSGIDPSVLWERRRHHVVAKWAEVGPINDGPLKFVRQVVLRL